MRDCSDPSWDFQKSCFKHGCADSHTMSALAHADSPEMAIQTADPAADGVFMTTALPLPILPATSVPSPAVWMMNHVCRNARNRKKNGAPGRI
jgi:hypothetical protein